MSKQTAVEWLEEQIKKDHPFWIDIFERAKAMEREQMGLPNCKPIDEHIISVTFLDIATGKTYTRTQTPETYKGGEQ